jgi:N-acetylglutamate synthase
MAPSWRIYRPGAGAGRGAGTGTADRTGQTGRVTNPEITDFERMAALHWRATEQEPLGEWLLRAAGGFTGRANSALAIGDPGRPAAQAVAAVQAWYARRGLPPLIYLPEPLDTDADTDTDTNGGGDRDGDGDGGALGALLAARGWTLRQAAPVIVMTARTATVAAHRDATLAGLRLAAEPDADWLAAWRPRGTPAPPHARPVLVSAPDQVFVTVHRDGRGVATGRLSLAGGWAGLTAIAVDPAWRRAGFGLAITTGLAAAALDRGAERIFLQVAAENTAARELYARCGFTDRHRYRYWTAPQAPAADPRR